MRSPLCTNDAMALPSPGSRCPPKSPALTLGNGLGPMICVPMTVLAGSTAFSCHSFDFSFDADDDDDDDDDEEATRERFERCFEEERFECFLCDFLEDFDFFLCLRFERFSDDAEADADADDDDDDDDDDDFDDFDDSDASDADSDGGSGDRSHSRGGMGAAKRCSRRTFKKGFV
jgi:hypothetical protein